MIPNKKQRPFKILQIIFLRTFFLYKKKLPTDLNMT